MAVDAALRSWLRLYQHVHLDHGLQHGASELVEIDQLNFAHRRDHAGGVFRNCVPHLLEEIPVMRVTGELATCHDGEGHTVPT